MAIRANNAIIACLGAVHQPKGKENVVLITVIVPVYNEKEAVQKVVSDVASALKQIDHEIIVVDDGSTDGSREILKSIGKIKLIENEENFGYGASIKIGLNSAAGDIIAIIDADGTYPADQLPSMLAELNANQMVVGTRKPLPPLNRLAKLILKSLVWLLTRRHVPDLNSGLRIFRREIAEKFLHLLPDGYSFTTTLTIACLVNRYNTSYVPIKYNPRHGKSKIRPIREFFNFAILITRLVTYFKPLEIFLPVSMFLFLAGLIIGLYSLIVHKRVMDVTTILLLLFSVQIAFLGLLADLIIRKK